MECQIVRVPTSTGKPGKSQKKVPCMEKSWNLKKTEKSWKNHGICEIICVFDCFFLATGDLSFYYCFKMHVWSTTGPALVVPDIL